MTAALPSSVPAGPFAAPAHGLGPHHAAVERVADLLATSAAARDRAGGTAWAERQLLRDSGLLALAVPTAFGGHGADWPLVQRAVRRLAQADSSLAHLFGFQHLQVASVLLFGSPQQQRRFLSATVAETWFWGNGVNARDNRLEARRTDGGWVLDGPKAFCSGARGSDALLVAVATGPQPQDRLFMVVPTGRDGVEVHDDWDNLGQRQTDSGTVAFHGVAVQDGEVLGPPGAASSPRATLRNLIGQMVLTEIYLGNAWGALQGAVRFVGEEARPWPMAGVERAADDPLLQLRTGEHWAALRGATALAEEATAAFQAGWDRGGDLRAEERAEIALTVAAARTTAARAALHVTAQVFELTGARSTTAPRALDRYWRNVRVHTLHDPLDHRSRGMGRWLLAGEPPDPYGYG